MILEFILDVIQQISVMTSLGRKFIIIGSNSGKRLFVKPECEPSNLQSEKIVFTSPFKNLPLIHSFKKMCNRFEVSQQELISKCYQFLLHQESDHYVDKYFIPIFRTRFLARMSLIKITYP